MRDAMGRALTPTEVAEWQAMNDDNASANDCGTTPSEFVCERGEPKIKDVSKKFGRVWQTS